MERSNGIVKNSNMIVKVELKERQYLDIHNNNNVAIYSHLRAVLPQGEKKTGVELLLTLLTKNKNESLQ